MTGAGDTAVVSTSPSEPPLLRRLNGRPQACDPCRRRKVACDHGQPVCKRCKKRNSEQECVYTITGSGSVRARRTIHQRASPIIEPSSNRPLPLPASVDATPPSTLNSHLRIPAIAQRGYLGFTSHSTVYEETRLRLSAVQGFGPWQSHANQTSVDVQPWDPSGLLASPTCEMWRVVLQTLPSPSACTVLPVNTPDQNSGWVCVAAKRILESLQDQFGDYLGAAHRSDAHLHDIAQFLSKNSAKPLSEHEADPEKWLGEFSGQNLRWESIGILFTIRDIGKHKAGPNDLSSREWLQVAIVCLGLCIDLVRRFSDGGSLLLQLCSRLAIMESILSGDASICCWRPHAESVALLTFLGLHAELDSDDYRPSLCSENRRRLTAATFLRDKVMVLFSGRPPLLGHRYNSTPLPLDLGDDDLLGSEETLTRAIQSLDHQGWNTDGALHSATLLRARTMCAFILDELIEIALMSKRSSVETLIDIKRRQNLVKTQFPLSLSYEPADLMNLSISCEIIYAKIIIQLEHLQNLFVAERLLLRLGQPDEGELLLISFEMVSLTLTFWTHKDRLADLRADFEWLLIAYAAPGGGILCMELLNPTFFGFHPKNAKVCRAAIIQQLSLLVGYLDWVQPKAPNADLCASCKSMIQHVLDHSLNGVSGSSWPPDALDPMQFDFNFEVLDTFSWARGQ